MDFKERFKVSLDRIKEKEITEMARKKDTILQKYMKAKTEKDRQRLLIDFITNFDKCRKTYRPRKEDWSINCSYGKYYIEFSWKEEIMYSIKKLTGHEIYAPEFMYVYRETDDNGSKQIKEISIEEWFDEYAKQIKKYKEWGIDI